MVKSTNYKAYKFYKKRHGTVWDIWIEYAVEWIERINKKDDDSDRYIKTSSLEHFFSYLEKRAPYAYDLELFFKGYKGHVCSEKEMFETIKDYSKYRRNLVFDFVQWVLEKKLTNTAEYYNPMYILDNNFGNDRWNPRFEEWKQYMFDYMRHTNNVNEYTKKKAFDGFLEYIDTNCSYALVVKDFLEGKGGHRITNNELLKYFNSKYSQDKSKQLINQLSHFIDYIILEHFSSVTNELTKIRLYSNPIKQIGSTLPQKYQDNSFQWLIDDYGQGWKQWADYAVEWVVEHENVQMLPKRKSLTAFFLHYLSPLPNAANIEDFFKENENHKHSIELLEEKISSDNDIQSTITSKRNVVINFIQWILDKDFVIDRTPDGKPVYKFRHPFQKPKKVVKQNKLKDFVWLTEEYGKKWSIWAKYAKEYCNENESSTTSLVRFFKDYLLARASYATNIHKFFRGIKTKEIKHKCSYEELESYIESSLSKAKDPLVAARSYARESSKFIDWIIKTYFTTIDKNGENAPTASNPLKYKKSQKTQDLNLFWLVDEYGEEWEDWRISASDYVKTLDKGVRKHLAAIRMLIEDYLIPHYNYSKDMMAFFNGYGNQKINSDDFLSLPFSTEVSKRRNIPLIIKFIDWLIDTHFSDYDDNHDKYKLYDNPFDKVSLPKNHSETTKNALPYKYIKRLRIILTSYKNDEWHDKNFNDWNFPQSQKGLHWYQVDESQIDRTDPDCVWRKKEFYNKSTKKNYWGFEMWSPVQAVALFVKLHLPLRTYQVRFLDSGEADTYRYEKGSWIVNKKHVFADQNIKNPVAKGVFHRTYDTYTEGYSTGLKINTNKTADQNKEDYDRGYVIPWENEEVLYWLEKLRNWQEKYNPIEKPKNCTELERKHFGDTKSKEQKQMMGEICFLFRNPQGVEGDKEGPITNAALTQLWTNLLYRMEEDLYSEGIRIGGERLQFTEEKDYEGRDYEIRGPLFGLHSLRVSLITSYTLDSSLPLPVISKLLAGHTRLFMTIYYNKISPSVMANKMKEAEAEIQNEDETRVLEFLKDTEFNQLDLRMVFNDKESAQVALAQKNPVGWETTNSIGICLAGGNIYNIGGNIPGCWNGGEVLVDSKNKKIYNPVPHGPKNCPRCRWFVSEAYYLDNLNKQFNYLGYKASLAASLSLQIEQELNILKDEEYECLNNDIPFLKQKEINDLENRYERQQVEADEFIKDYIATYEIIKKIINIEHKRDLNDTGSKIVTVGTQEDVEHILSFSEVDSEFLYYNLLCEDAEFYPNMRDELKKTPLIQKRTNMLSRIFMRAGYQPVFMELNDEEQIFVINALMRRMAFLSAPNNKLEGFRKASNYLEAEKYLQDDGLLAEAIKDLSKEKAVTLSIKKLIGNRHGN